MVNVTHDNNNRRSGLEVVGRSIICIIVEEDIFLRYLLKESSVDTECISKETSRIEVELLVDGSEYAELHEFLDNIGALLADTLCKILYSDERRDLDIGDDLLDNRLSDICALLLFLPAV